MKSNIMGIFKLKKHLIDEKLLNQAKKEGNIIYGGQAIRKKLGILARRTEDYDFFSRHPKKSGNTSQRNLDKLFRRDVFFEKKGKHPGTWKVKFVGPDLKKNTKDDIGIADYTKTPKKTPKTFTYHGIKYRTLREELKAKKKLLRSKGFEYRRKKDLEDLKRIRKFGGLRKL